MLKNHGSKVTPISAKLFYEKAIADKAKNYAELFRGAFPTESSLLIALDNAVRFLTTSYVALNGNVTADYFCLHSPLANYPDQLLSLMVLFVDCGVFVPTDEDHLTFSLDCANTWKFVGFQGDAAAEPKGDAAEGEANK